MHNAKRSISAVCQRAFRRVSPAEARFPQTVWESGAQNRMPKNVWVSGRGGTYRSFVVEPENWLTFANKPQISPDAPALPARHSAHAQVKSLKIPQILVLGFLQAGLYSEDDRASTGSLRQVSCEWA
jgi:hypothetical protein